jgi:hypothetical protein
VQYAIDVSWPKNCKEPYWIKDIETEGMMTTTRGCSYVSVKCYDWVGPDDVESIYIDTYPFTGGLTPMEHNMGTYEWEALILNSFQTTIGEYECLIQATSYDSTLKLYDYVTIVVEEPTLDSPFQGGAYNSVTLMPVEEATVTTSDGQEFFTGTTDICGVYALDDVPEGKRVISFAKPYYQTIHYSSLYEGEPLVVDGIMIPVMDDPPPLPEVTINEPFIKWEFGEASVTGTIENLDYQAAVMCHNHEEYLMQVDEFTGEYQYDVQLTPGLNYIRIRATNATGSVFSEEKIVDYGTADYPFKLVLTWDTITDQDFHGWDPNFNHCYYIDQDWPTMFLDVDIIMQGYGPETITGLDVVPGRYYFAVNYYLEHDQSGDTMNTVDVTVNPGTIYVDHQVFQHTLSYGNMNDDYPIYGDTSSWWRVCDIVIDDNYICYIEDPDTDTALYE